MNKGYVLASHHVVKFLRKVSYFRNLWIRYRLNPNRSWVLHLLMQVIYRDASWSFWVARDREIISRSMALDSSSYLEKKEDRKRLE
jgi:hypothetical protein